MVRYMVVRFMGGESAQIALQVGKCPEWCIAVVVALWKNNVDKYDYRNHGGINWDVQIGKDVWLSDG